MFHRFPFIPVCSSCGRCVPLLHRGYLCSFWRWATLCRHKKQEVPGELPSPQPVQPRKAPIFSPLSSQLPLTLLSRELLRPHARLLFSLTLPAFSWEHFQNISWHTWPCFLTGFWRTHTHWPHSGPVAQRTLQVG